MPIVGKCEMYFNGKLISGFDARTVLYEDKQPDPRNNLVDFMDLARKESAAGSFTAIATWTREAASKFLAAFEIELPKPDVRQRGLAIELGGTQPMTVGLPDGRSFTGKSWSKIGVARSGHTQRQLRKFVKRGDKLVEVRARGRTGSRVLQEAVAQAGVEGCFSSEFTVEGNYG